MTAQEEAALEAALNELEAAAWARSWRRLRSAREQIKILLGVELGSQLRKELEGAK